MRKPHFRSHRLLMLILFLIHTNAWAQFTSASITQYSHGMSSGQPRKTGSDIVELSGNIYRVSAFEPTGAGMLIIKK